MRTTVLTLALALAACASQPKPVTPTAVAAESNVDVCVIDTIAPGGMMSINAISVPATHDTVVIQPQGRVPIAQLTAGPAILSQATWITSKKPLTISAAGGRVIFKPTGQPRTFEIGRIMLLAMMRGVPVFATPSEAAALRPELEALAARGIDLEKALATHATLRRQADKLNTLYMPTSLVGCMFQQFNRVTRRR